jgi:hypothetical protein
MNRFTIAAAALLAGASALAGAQQPAAAPEVPRHKCEPKPVLPGQRMMADESVRKRFQRDLEAYKTCMKAFADERAAAAKAHTDAGNAAINEYNDTMKALQDAQNQR